ncbi:hypothetical protein Sbal183_0255 [Shewanella baltica OS183]|uniref:hypothetical protein n=1 Tax=Shewanella baltica TaxID=62322 RepID=UPI0001E10993|nr:hypothetical protein [Shewanella baltica]AEG13262.1 hypothetical protein Sbal175_4040 [Shewanella baltica BA175]EHQ13195.1 hypothetical protein Sbal183_0255 [Shewanella baltica OS183]
MNVKELIVILQQLNPEMEVIGFTANGEKFNDANRVYKLEELKLIKARRERARTKLVDATLNFLLMVKSKPFSS